ncbi:MAG: hypothetical protein ABJL99_06395 [Aliishimia sp.]
MPRKQPFKRHRFPAAVVLCAVRMYLRYPLSYQDVVDLLSTAGFKSLALNLPSEQRSTLNAATSIGTLTQPTYGSVENSGTCGAQLMRTARWWIFGSQ